MPLHHSLVSTLRRLRQSRFNFDRFCCFFSLLASFYLYFNFVLQNTHAYLSPVNCLHACVNCIFCFFFHYFSLFFVGRFVSALSHMRIVLDWRGYSRYVCVRCVYFIFFVSDLLKWNAVETHSLWMLILSAKRKHDIDLLTQFCLNFVECAQKSGYTRQPLIIYDCYEYAKRI